MRPLPAACLNLPALVLPAGTSAAKAMELQHAHILALEKQLVACANGSLPADQR